MLLIPTPHTYQPHRLVLFFAQNRTETSFHLRISPLAAKGKVFLAASYAPESIRLLTRRIQRVTCEALPAQSIGLCLVQGQSIRTGDHTSVSLYYLLKYNILSMCSTLSQLPVWYAYAEVIAVSIRCVSTSFERKRYFDRRNMFCNGIRISRSRGGIRDERIFVTMYVDDMMIVGRIPSEGTLPSLPSPSFKFNTAS